MISTDLENSIHGPAMKHMDTVYVPFTTDAEEMLNLRSGLTEYSPDEAGVIHKLK